MKIRTTKPHEYVTAELGMKIMVDWYASDDEDIRDYFMNHENNRFYISEFDNEDDMIWLRDSEFAIEASLAIKAE